MYVCISQCHVDCKFLVRCVSRNLRQVLRKEMQRQDQSIMAPEVDNNYDHENTAPTHHSSDMHLRWLCGCKRLMPFSGPSLIGDVFNERPVKARGGRLLYPLLSKVTKMLCVVMSIENLEQIQRRHDHSLSWPE